MLRAASKLYVPSANVRGETNLASPVSSGLLVASGLAVEDSLQENNVAVSATAANAVRSVVFIDVMCDNEIGPCDSRYLDRQDKCNVQSDCLCWNTLTNDGLSSSEEQP